MSKRVCHGHIQKLHGSLPVLQLIYSFLWANEVALVRQLDTLHRDLSIQGQTLGPKFNWPEKAQPSIGAAILGDGAQLRLVYNFALLFPKLKHLVLNAHSFHQPYGPYPVFYFPELRTLHIINWINFRFKFLAPHLERLTYENTNMTEVDVEDLQAAKKSMAKAEAERCHVSLIGQGKEADYSYLTEHLDTSVDIGANPICFTLDKLNK